MRGAKAELAKLVTAELDESSKAIVCKAGGLGLREFLSAWAAGEGKPWIVPAQGGDGHGGGPVRKVGVQKIGTAPNVFSRKDWNMTAQGRLSPEERDRMARAAGFWMPRAQGASMRVDDIYALALAAVFNLVQSL